jgi:predicted RNA-binding protein YlxR (DUF448 family)
VIRASASVTRRRPRRTCVACRTERDKHELVRFVRTPTGDVLFDASGRLAGRGAYLCADGSCWALARKKSSLERALGVALPADLRVRLEASEAQSIAGGAHGA